MTYNGDVPFLHFVWIGEVSSGEAPHSFLIGSCRTYLNYGLIGETLTVFNRRG